MTQTRSNWLFNEQPAGTSRADIIKWWESRRLTYNMLVGAVGVISWLSVLIAGSAAVKDGVDFEEPLAMIFGPFVYGFMADICYTFGWIFDIAFGNSAPSRNRFRNGLIFSLVLTALPGLWAVFCWVMTIITGHKLD
ncbi:MAG TPA: hypothetical protein VF493_13520 [Terriglobales bacterium]